MKGAAADRRPGKWNTSIYCKGTKAIQGFCRYTFREEEAFMPEVVVTLADTAASVNSEPGNGMQLSPDEELVSLRRLIAEKDHAVIRAVVSSSEMQHELETAKAESIALKALLEVAKERPQAAMQAEMNGEILKLTAKFNHARKTLEREHNKVRSEVVTLRGQSQQLQHQLDNERKARQIESARASGQIASLEKDLATAYGEKSASGMVQSRERATRLWLGAAAVATTLIVSAAVFGWSQMAAKSGPAGVTGEDAPQVAGSSVTKSPIPAQFSGSQHGFQGALGDLNNALADFPERRPEDVLAEVRRRNSVSDPSVCAFAWNGGQPALLYGGQNKSVSLGGTLTKCAQAVEKLRMH
jgi:hypothetical protein